MAAKFDFAVHLCAVRLIEKPEAFSGKLLIGVLLGLVGLAVQPGEGDLVGVAFHVFPSFPFRYVHITVVSA